MYHVVPGMALPAASLYDSQVLPTMLVQDGKPAEVRRSGRVLVRGWGGGAASWGGTLPQRRTSPS